MSEVEPDEPKISLALPRLVKNLVFDKDGYDEVLQLPDMKTPAVSMSFLSTTDKAPQQPATYQ